MGFHLTFQGLLTLFSVASFVFGSLCEDGYLLQCLFRLEEFCFTGNSENLMILSDNLLVFSVCLGIEPYPMKFHIILDGTSKKERYWTRFVSLPSLERIILLFFVSVGNPSQHAFVLFLFLLFFFFPLKFSILNSYYNFCSHFSVYCSLELLPFVFFIVLENLSGFYYCNFVY